MDGIRAILRSITRAALGRKVDKITRSTWRLQLITIVYLESLGRKLVMGMSIP